MTKTLTEQWKSVELPSGLYYFRKTDGLIYIEFHDDYRGFCTPEEYIKEVLAPVPRYNEYKRLQERLEIATKALKRYEDRQNWDIRGVAFMKYNKGFTIARKALKEMEGVK